jgi:hypothetical protein
MWRDTHCRHLLDASGGDAPLAPLLGLDRRLLHETGRMLARELQLAGRAAVSRTFA